MKKLLRDYRFEITIFGIFAIAYVVFCSYYMTEVINQSWFEQVEWLGKYFSNTLTLGDYFSTYGEHGMFGTNLLMVINAELFGFTTMFDVYVNDIIVIFSGILSIVAWKNAMRDKCGKLIFRVGVVFIVFFMFNILQGSASAMETQVRCGMFFCIVAMYMCDRVFRENVSTKYYVVTLCVIVLSINVFGSLYSFATAAGVCFVALIKIATRNSNKKVIGLLGFHVLCWVVYVMEYRILSRGLGGDSSLIEVLSQAIIQFPKTLQSLFAYSGSFLLGYPSMADNLLSGKVYLSIGFCVFLVAILSCAVYVKKKYYKVTYLPILFIIYSYAVWLMVFVGRFSQSQGEWEWFTNWWYFVHTKIATVGIVWILLMCIKDTKVGLLKAGGKIALAFLTVVGIFGYYTELKRVPYEKVYYENMQPYLFAESIDELPVDENNNTPLLHNPEMTMKGIEILKENNLSVYRYYGSYERMEKIRNAYQPISGLYDDGWATKDACFRITTKDDGLIKISGYYNQEITGNEKISVYQAGTLLKEYTIVTPEIEFEIPSTPNAVVELEIKCNFSFAAEPPDIRELSFLIDDIIVE